MTELAGTQLSSLLETLPGIATVLRSPVADAMVNLVKAASGQAAFSMADAEELLRYAIRRNLIAADESERVLAETRDYLAGVPRAPVVTPAVPKAEPKLDTRPRKPVAKPPVPAKKAVKPVKLSKPIPAKKKAKPAKASAKASRAAHKKK